MWVILSILAALFWSVNSIVDKYILTKWVKQPLIPVIILGVVGLIASFLIYLVQGFEYLSYLNLILAILSGLVSLLATIFYFKALKVEEVSKIVPFFYFSPLFVLILATIFLGEVFTFDRYIGIFLIVIGAVLITSNNHLKLRFGKAFKWMISSIFLFSVGYILTKYLLGFTDYWTIFAYARIGTAIGIIPIIYIYFPELVNITKKHGKKVVIAMSVSETLNISAILLVTIAASMNYVTLIQSLSSTQPFFVLLFTVVLSIFFPSILKERISRSIILWKLLAIILMFIGVILII